MATVTNPTKTLIDYVPQTKQDWAYLDKFFALLAEEKITVVRRPTSTASFDTKRRIVTIPNYATEDKDIFLLMGSHEVSHALNTPIEWCHDEVNNKIHNSVMRDCLNIIEDIRIERIIRRKFPGFVPIYVRAYKKLLAGNDFFSIDNWNNFSIADRINAYAKLGKDCPPMTDRDLAIYKYVSDVKTYKDVIARAYYLYELLKNERNNKITKKGSLSQGDGNATDDSGSSSSDDKPDTEDASGDAGTSENCDADSTNADDAKDRKNSEQKANSTQSPEDINRELAGENSMPDAMSKIEKALDQTKAKYEDKTAERPVISAPPKFNRRVASWLRDNTTTSSRGNLLSYIEKI